jgi:hypothetical protein
MIPPVAGRQPADFHRLLIDCTHPTGYSCPLALSESVNVIFA